MIADGYHPLRAARHRVGPSRDARHVGTRRAPPRLSCARRIPHELPAPPCDMRLSLTITSPAPCAAWACRSVGLRCTDAESARRGATAASSPVRASSAPASFAAPSAPFSALSTPREPAEPVSQPSVTAASPGGPPPPPRPLQPSQRGGAFTAAMSGVSPVPVMRSMMLVKV